jgi:ABC-type transporter Mla subunit MlaD
MTPTKLKLTAAMIAIGVASFAAGTLAQGRYPEINQAEGSLQTALAQLRAARDVFGGHKQNAEGLIQQALGQLQAGKGFAAAHGM